MNLFRCVKLHMLCACRLAGAALVVPVINYWWPSFPAELSRQAFKKQVVPEQRTLWIAHNVPSLLYLWMTQKWLPSSAAATHNPEIFSKHDMEVLQKMMAMPRTIEVNHSLRYKKNKCTT
jgi:hypothetical protein